MIILQDTDSTQVIKFIPRRWVTGRNYNINIINETTNTDAYNVNSTAITETLYYNSYSASFPNLKENIFYNLIITGITVAGIVFKDRIFCTNQTVLDYSVNNGEYTQQASSNEYITV
tara:strand:+ start:251 stop:601 length:351 start_codon:yes stop_codon:yes gene_type:complete